MSELLDRAIKAVQDLPPSMQDDIARIVLACAGDEQPPIQLTPEESDFAEADAEIARGEFATDEEVAAIFAKHRL